MNIEPFIHESHEIVKLGGYPMAQCRQFIERKRVHMVIWESNELGGERLIYVDFRDGKAFRVRTSRFKAYRRGRDC